MSNVSDNVVIKFNFIVHFVVVTVFLLLFSSAVTAYIQSYALKILACTFVYACDIILPDSSHRITDSSPDRITLFAAKMLSTYVSSSEVASLVVS